MPTHAIVDVSKACGCFGSLSATFALLCLVDVILRVFHNHATAYIIFETEEGQNFVFIKGILNIIDYLFPLCMGDYEPPKGRLHHSNNAALSFWNTIDEAILNYCQKGYRYSSHDAAHLPRRAVRKCRTGCNIEEFALLDLDFETSNLRFDRRAALHSFLEYIDLSSSHSIQESCHHGTKLSTIENLKYRAHYLRDANTARDQNLHDIRRVPQNREHQSTVSEKAFCDLLDRLEIY